MIEITTPQLSFSQAVLYLNPGTGGLLVSVIMGIATTAFFVLKRLYYRGRQIITGNAKHETTDLGTDKQNLVIYSKRSQYASTLSPILQELERLNIPCTYLSSDPSDPVLQLQSSLVHTKYIESGHVTWGCPNTQAAELCVTTNPGLDVMQIERPARVRHYVTVSAWMTVKFAVRMLACSVFAALCTSTIYIILTQCLPSTPIPPVTPSSLFWLYALERTLLDPMSETILLFPFALAFIHLWELKPMALHCCLRNGFRPPRVRLLVASGMLAVLFTLIHVASHGLLACSTLPASWLLMFSYLAFLSTGQPLKAMISSFIIHSGHNGLLINATSLSSILSSVENVTRQLIATC